LQPVLYRISSTALEYLGDYGVAIGGLQAQGMQRVHLHTPLKLAKWVERMLGTLAHRGVI
jgi:hypothetical protein